MQLKRFSIVFASALMISSSLPPDTFAATIKRNVTASVSPEATETAESTTGATESTNGTTESTAETVESTSADNTGTNTAPDKVGTGDISTPGDHIPSTVNNVTAPSNLDLDSVVAKAGFEKVGNGNTNPEPVLGETQMVHYVLRNASEQDISAAESNTSAYAYSKDGFNNLFLDHSGIGRYYFRTYNTKSGWSRWMNSKENENNTDPEDKVQAVQIRVKGYTGVRSDLYYKAVLSDGTVLDWAKNGQTLGTVGTDKYIVALKLTLWDKQTAFSEPTKVLMEAPVYEGTYLDADGQVQYSSANAYTGWAFYNNDQYYFKDGAKQKGWQYIDGYKYYLDENTGVVVKDLEPIMGLQSSYQIKFNKASMTMHIMAKDGNNGYIIPYKTFMSTNGPATPEGSFKTYVKYRWKIMHDNIYCQFLSRFKDGYIIHSLIYYDKGDPNKLDSATYNYMDDARSDGCLRLRAGDAAWVYYNTPMGTPVIVYTDYSTKGPVEKDAIEQPIPASQTFDPTDPLMQGNN